MRISILLSWLFVLPVLWRVCSWLSLLTVNLDFLIKLGNLCECCRCETIGSCKWKGIFKISNLCELIVNWRMASTAPSVLCSALAGCSVWGRWLCDAMAPWLCPRPSDWVCAHWGLGLWEGHLTGSYIHPTATVDTVPPQHAAADSTALAAPQPLGSSSCAVCLAGHPAARNFALAFEEGNKILECNFHNRIHSCLRGLWESNPNEYGLRESGVPGSFSFSWFWCVAPKISTAGRKR